MFYTESLRNHEDRVLALIRDDLSGLTLVAPAREAADFIASCEGRQLEVSGALWRAFEIRMGAGAEVPGVISLVSAVLASRDISILNFSTYDSDIILVPVRRGLRDRRDQPTTGTDLFLFWLVHSLLTSEHAHQVRV